MPISVIDLDGSCDIAAAFRDKVNRHGFLRRQLRKFFPLGAASMRVVERHFNIEGHARKSRTTTRSVFRSTMLMVPLGLGSPVVPGQWMFRAGVCGVDVVFFAAQSAGAHKAIENAIDFHMRRITCISS